MRLRAPAKINLTLEVLAKHPGGYHGIRSLMVPLALADELLIEPAADGFSLSCDNEHLSTNDNLVVRAFQAVFGTAATGEKSVDRADALPPFKITLRKCIPTEAGLGGGSSDAATILLAAINGQLGTIPDSRDWVAIARSLGSDVPFFLTQTGALVEGTGERVTAVGALPEWPVIIVKPPAAISTTRAYATLDAHERATRPRNESISLRALTALQRQDFEEVVHCLSNDFHEITAAAEPTVAKAIEALKTAGATNTLLAGSGSSVFTLVKTPEQAKKILAQLSLPNNFAIHNTHIASNSSWKK